MIILMIIGIRWGIYYHYQRALHIIESDFPFSGKYDLFRNKLNIKESYSVYYHDSLIECNALLDSQSTITIIRIGFVEKNIAMDSLLDVDTIDHGSCLKHKKFIMQLPPNNYVKFKTHFVLYNTKKFEKKPNKLVLLVNDTIFDVMEKTTPTFRMYHIPNNKAKVYLYDKMNHEIRIQIGCYAENKSFGNVCVYKTTNNELWVIIIGRIEETTP